MPDYPFTPQDVPRAGVYAAARYVSLGFAAGGTVPRQPSVDQVSALHDRVRLRWRQLLSELFAAGVGFLPTARHLQYCRNCPPVGFSTADKSRACRNALLCPFCHARQNVVELFCRMECAFWADGRPDGLSLVEFRNTIPRASVDAAVGAAGLADCRDEALSFCLSAFRGIVEDRRLRKKEFSRLPESLGGFALHGVSYSPDALPLLSRSGAAVVPYGSVVPFERKAGFSFEVHPRLTKSLLCGVLARVCRYQSGWLTSASAGEVAEYAAIMRRVRMLSTFGAAYGAERPESPDF